jgi:hypothetical protein
MAARGSKTTVGYCCGAGASTPTSSDLALQLSFMEVSESMGNHDSEIVDASSVD